MSKVPFVIIGILLITAIFLVVFTRVEEKNPLAALGETTPTPSMNINLGGNNQSPEQTNAQIQDKSTLTTQQGQPQQGTNQQAQQSQQTNQNQQNQQQKIEPVTANAATIHTAKGDIVLQLYPQDAPKTVQNFSTLAKYGYYNNLTFHRVEPGFVIQGGDPSGNGTGGYSIYGPTFEDELNSETESYKAGYVEGVLAMANRGPNTNGSQFFIMLADNPLPHSYTIFGKVTEGMDVVKQIAKGDIMTSIELLQ